MTLVRRLLPGIAGFTLALAAGCGVSTDDRPHEISQSNVPEGFGDDPATTDPATRTAQPGERVGIWLLHDEDGEVLLTRRTRPVPRPPSDAAILEALLEGPTRQERDASITTAIPRSTRLATAPDRVGEVLVVDLSDGFFQVNGDDLRNAYAQIVCTADEIDGVRAVEFQIDGSAVGAFDGDGQSSDRPMRCRDYEQLLPPG